MQAPQLGARLDADLLDKRAPGRPVSLERVGLAPAAVQREHELSAQTLAQRMQRDQLPQLGHELAVRSDREIRFDAQLDARPGAARRGWRWRPARTVRTRTPPAAGRATSRVRRAASPPHGPPRPPPTRPAPPALSLGIARHPAHRARSAADSQPASCSGRRDPRAPAAAGTHAPGRSGSHRPAHPPPTDATARRSVLTASLACRTSIASAARTFPPVTGISPEAARTSSGPRIRNSIAPTAAEATSADELIHPRSPRCPSVAPSDIAGGPIRL